jgi:OmpA-like transmembrane domain
MILKINLGLKMKKMIVGLMAASAASFTFAQTGFKPGFYLGADAGYTIVDNNAQAFANGLVATNGGSASVTQNRDISVGRIYTGYKITENFDVEVGYFASGNVSYRFSGVSSGNTAYAGTADVAAKGIDYSILMRPNISTGWNSAFLQVGGHSSKETVDVYGTNIRGGKSSASGTGYLYGAGYDLNIAKDIDIRLKATYLNKIAGTSDDATIYSVGVIGRF